MKEEKHFGRTDALGYQTYLDEKKRNSTWHRVQHGSIVKAFLSFAQKSKEIHSLVLDDLLNSHGLLSSSSTPALKPLEENLSEDEEALLALFPEKITSFFADPKTQQLLAQENASEVYIELEQLEQNNLEDIEEDPFLGDMARNISKSEKIPENKPLDPFSQTSFKKKSSINQIPLQPIPVKIKVDSGSHTTKKPSVLERHHLNRLDQERISLFQEQASFVSRSINHLSDAYFDQRNLKGII